MLWCEANLRERERERGGRERERGRGRGGGRGRGRWPCRHLNLCPCFVNWPGMAAHQLCLPSCRPHCCHPCLVCLSCSDVWLVARFLLRTMAALIRCYLRCFLRPVFKVKSFLFCKQSVQLMYYELFLILYEHFKNRWWNVFNIRWIFLYTVNIFKIHLTSF